MAKVKGFYNVINQTFLGPMVAEGDNKARHTPKYVEGVCYGEYCTQTHEFVPLTNPMFIPTGSIFTEDEQYDSNGNTIVHRTGIEEDKGVDLARRGTLVAGHRFSKTPGVETRDANGRVYSDAQVAITPKKLSEEIESVIVSAPANTPNTSDFKVAEESEEISDLPKINWDSLF